MEFLTAFAQYENIGLYILRLAVAIVFISHAVPKLTKPKRMAAGMGGNSAVPFTLGLVELLSSIGLILGWYVGLSALLLAVVMSGAIFMKTTKWKVPFSANEKTGWEFDFTLLASNLAILLTGGGNIVLL